MKATSRVIPFPRPKPRPAEELEFLPAALEIVETPPSPLGRALGATILAMVVLGLTMGKFWSSGYRCNGDWESHSKRSQQGYSALRDRRRAPHSRLGGPIRQPGQTLIELDPTINDGEINHLEGDLQSAELDIARLHAALADTDDPLAAFHPPEGANRGIWSRCSDNFCFRRFRSTRRRLPLRMRKGLKRRVN